MKKRIALGIGILAFVISSHAQLEKGTLLIGGSGSFSGGFGSGSRSYGFDLLPNAGYFVANKFAMGSELGFQNQVMRSNSINYLGSRVFLSPFVRYYFLPSAFKLNLFGQVGFTAGGAWGIYNNSNFSRFEVSTNIKTGVSYFINPQIALEAAIVADHNPNTPYFISNNMIRGTLGFQIHLNSRKKQTPVLAE